jgi:capsule polysaccharide export protein KpsE/RkpR
VRVRATQARIDELHRQLQKLNGQQGTTVLNNEDDESMYPSIRKLPLLGVSYADLYRGTKVEEAVFEVLTQQYELAKVEEAKETPSIKVLDPPDIPEKKSSPHRLLIMILGSSFALLFGSIWVLSGAHWREIDPQEPGKVLALEVLATVKTRLPHFSSNGSSAGKAREANEREDLDLTSDRGRGNNN